MIHYVQGDATEPVVKTGHRYILHITNDRGAWGAGFVRALSAKWPDPEREYRAHKPVLGTCQFVPVSNDITVVNMCAQAMHGNHRVRYSALDRCIEEINIRTPAGIVPGAFTLWPENKKNITFHMPRIGCGLGGGVWEDVEYFVSILTSDVYVYDL